jgi:metal-dependent amidase/aminoacylase/carboxypeptidase family protein
MAYGCEAIVEYSKGYPVTCNAQSAVDVFNQTAMAALGEDRVEYLEQPVMGGEDFSFYCNEVPSCFFALGLVKPEGGPMPTLHHPSFDFNDDAMPTGIEMFCRLALRN